MSRFCVDWSSSSSSSFESAVTSRVDLLEIGCDGKKKASRVPFVSRSIKSTRRRVAARPEKKARFSWSRRRRRRRQRATDDDDQKLFNRISNHHHHHHHHSGLSRQRKTDKNAQILSSSLSLSPALIETRTRSKKRVKEGAYLFPPGHASKIHLFFFFYSRPDDTTTARTQRREEKRREEKRMSFPKKRTLFRVWYDKKRP